MCNARCECKDKPLCYNCSYIARCLCEGYVTFGPGNKIVLGKDEELFHPTQVVKIKTLRFPPQCVHHGLQAVYPQEFERFYRLPVDFVGIRNADGLLQVDDEVNRYFNIDHNPLYSSEEKSCCDWRIVITKASIVTLD